MKNRWILSLFLAFLLAACCSDDSVDSQPVSIESANNSTVAEEIGESATIAGVALSYPEEWPQAIDVLISGSLPDGCTEISNVVQTRTPNKIVLQVRTSRPVDMNCTMALEPFSTTTTIDLRGLEAGVYQVDVYGHVVEFELDTYSEPEDQGG